MAELTPFLLKDEPALIESVFPVQKVSYEAQEERTSVQSQTLTGLGSYWKGRKPLILVRSIVLGSLLPKTSDKEKDLEIFEMLMGFDSESLAKRAFTKNSIKPVDIATSIILNNPWDYFIHNIKNEEPQFEEVEALQFPVDTNAMGLKIRWRRDVEAHDKILLFTRFLEQLDTYEQKSSLCKRPEECDQGWLYSHVWVAVNRHLSELSVKVESHHSLIEQLGVLRFGRKPMVGDVFSGGGSIPFEAARVGCDSYASDLNPVACMLTWGSTEIVGASAEKREEINSAQQKLVDEVEGEIYRLGIELDEEGNRAKAFLCCLEARCPETGWVVPLIPSLVVSKSRNIIAELVADHDAKRFDIEVVSGVTKEVLKAADIGTVQSLFGV